MAHIGQPRESFDSDTSRSLLTSTEFVLASALLLINDWVLKSALGYNWFTGKLSDVAGLFAFPLLWTALVPTRRDAAFALTAAGFVVWKSPMSDVPLAAWNALGVWPLTRVVDYTDLIALAVLLPAYWVARRHAAPRPIGRPRVVRRVASVVTGVVAFMAFAATSIPPPRYEVDDRTGYLMSATRSDVREGLHALGVYVIDLSSKGSADTLLIYIRQPPERVVGVTLEAREVTTAEVRIRLLGISAPGPEPKTESVQRVLRTQVLEPLREWVARRRTSREQ
jgi:hypothetical protein